MDWLTIITDIIVFSTKQVTKTTNRLNMITHLFVYAIEL